MNLQFSEEYVVFRDEVRAFLARAAIPRAGGDMRAWQKQLIAAGYAARTIPREYGGFGAAPDILQSRIIAEEFVQAGAPMGIANHGYFDAGANLA